MGTKHDLQLRTSGVSWKRVFRFDRYLTDGRMAMMEIRLMVSALIMNYGSWTGVPDKPGEWDEEMKPFNATLIHPVNGKCVLKLEPRT